jgi:large subunit ribosomal protein L33
MLRLIGSIMGALPGPGMAVCVPPEAPACRNAGFSARCMSSRFPVNLSPDAAENPLPQALIAGKCTGFDPQNLDFGRIEARLRGECGPIGRLSIPLLFEVLNMAKAVTIKVKLVSSADTGFYYVAKKNSRTMTDKLVKKKYDPVARKHVEFRESKIK